MRTPSASPAAAAIAGIRPGGAKCAPSRSVTSAANGPSRGRVPGGGGAGSAAACSCGSGLLYGTRWDRAGLSRFVHRQREHVPLKSGQRHQPVKVGLDLDNAGVTAESEVVLPQLLQGKASSGVGDGERSAVLLRRRGRHRSVSAHGRGRTG